MHLGSQSTNTLINNNLNKIMQLKDIVKFLAGNRTDCSLFWLWDTTGTIASFSLDSVSAYFLEGYGITLKKFVKMNRGCF